MEITAGELAVILEGTVDGDSSSKITGFAKIEEAGEGDLTFLSNPKYSKFVSDSKASVVLVPLDFVSDKKIAPTLVKVKDPYVSLAKLMRYYESLKPAKTGVEEPVFISSGFKMPEKCYLGAFTYIGKNVSLGERVQVYPQVYIGDDVTIGEDTIIYAGVKIYSGSKIGSRCIIHSGCVIGSDGFGFAPNEGVYEKIPQLGIVEISDDVEIGANTTIDRATFGKTQIGKGTKLDNLIQIAHNVTMGENNVVAAQAGIAGSVKIGSGNRIGGQTGFAGHITIGDGNEFGAQSGIHTNVGNSKRLIGYPAVDILQFAKTSVYLRRLDELFRNKETKK